MRRGARQLAVGMAVATACAVGSAAAEARVERPIVYAVVIDGLDGDRVDQGKAPFISSLLAGQGGAATYYRESRSVMIAETNPNHTSMMTGAYGARSGIPGNAFAVYAPLENEDSCRTSGPRDLTKLPSLTSGENFNCLQAQTVFEAVKRQGDPDGLLTAAIFGKPKLGRIFAGRFADGRNRDADHVWAPCASGADDDDYCGNVPTNPATGYATDDRTVMDEVIRTMREGVGPQRRRPDFTFVNLHQVDSAGHGTSPGPPIPIPVATSAYDAAIAQADTEIERLVGELRSRGEWGRSVLVLLSDHSMDFTPGRATLTSSFEDAGIPADSFVVVQNGSVDMVYLANRTDPGRFELLRRMRAAALGESGVDEALYREPNPADGGAANSLGGAHPAWRLAGDRTGDLVVTSKPGTAFSDPSGSSNPLPGNHGSPYTRDNFFAVTGGARFVRQQDLAAAADPRFDDTGPNGRQAENADVAPTVMGLFGLFAPRQNAARFLGEAFDLAQLPGRGAPASRPRLRVKRVRPKRKRGARRARCSHVVRYRLSWTPRGGRYDLEARTRGKHKRLLRNSRKAKRALKARRGERYRLRVRMRAASGAPGRWTRRGLRVPRCRQR